jgi:hypothetical protein
MSGRQSSSAMSSIAARVLRMTIAKSGEFASANAFNALLADAKALAGSVLSQDETRGQAAARDEGDTI